MKKKIFSIWSILLVLVVAIAVLVPGCEGEAVQYDLTIDSTAGGVTTPAEGTRAYDDGTVVDLVATPDCDYAFVNWTGDTDTIDDVNAAATKITMNADYSITANFAPLPLDHFRAYWLGGSPPSMDENVQLEDQFGAFNATVEEAYLFANPVEKVHDAETTPISDPNNHLTFYGLYYEEDYVMQSVEVSNQFGSHNLSLYGPIMLAVPTQKVVPGDHEPPECLDHYLVYLVENVVEIVVSVDLNDQFGSDQGVIVYAPVFFANPVKKTHDTVVTDIVEPEDHLVLYATDSTLADTQVEVGNQFGEPQILDLTYSELLAVPSQKIAPPVPSLDHFKCYAVLPQPPLVDVYADLEDQFGYFDDAQVVEPVWFCNPVKKNSELIVNPDNHLTVYDIIAPQQEWNVVVDNQFGNDQTLTVTGPVALAVPTWKLEPGVHDPPKYLDHFLLYTVIGPPVDVTVDLDDQFPGSAPGVTVTTPVYFANPATKGYIDHVSAPWTNEHLVFYDISTNPEFLPLVVVDNQFQSQPLELIDSQLLAVPSVKLYFEPVPE